MSLVLTVAGSDPVGGAGIQADIKAISSMDVHACSVITAVTSQNTCKVTAIRPLDRADVMSQLDAVLSDVHVDAIKTGMLYSKEIARTVGERLRDVGSPLVVDPVLVAGVGDELYSGDLLEAIRSEIFPLATVITPNRGEAELLIGRKIGAGDDLGEVCRELAAMGPEAVILKGGHFDGDDATDLLFRDDEMMEVSMPRIDRKVHGGGCTLSSFIACGLAKGKDVKHSLLEAKRRIHDSIALSYPIGQGMFVINPMATIQKESNRYTALGQLERAAWELVSGSSRFHLERKASFLFALPNPQGYDEVCEVGVLPGGFERGKVGRSGASYGSGGPVTRRLLSMNRVDTRTLSALQITVSPEFRAGPFAGELDPMTSDHSQGSMLKGHDWGDMVRAVVISKKVPDLVLVESDGERSVMFLGKDPQDVLGKVRKVFF
jgi:hydroxymethylpyrimidine kinase/phosphomethylpyrimidine kinase